MRHRPEGQACSSLTHLALASALALALPMAQAAITVTGPYGSNPGGLLVGPGDTDLGGSQLFFGGSADTLLRVDDGS